MLSIHSDIGGIDLKKGFTLWTLHVFLVFRHSVQAQRWLLYNKAKVLLKKPFFVCTLLPYRGKGITNSLGQF